MTLVVTVTCDGTWESVACRGALSNHLEQPLLDRLRQKAIDAGWLLTNDRDLCPAHGAKEK